VAKWLRLTLTTSVRRRFRSPARGFMRPMASPARLNCKPPRLKSERDENPGETRLTLNLGAANLTWPP
jgi:hypothetical protein